LSECHNNEIVYCNKVDGHKEEQHSWLKEHICNKPCDLAKIVKKVCKKKCSHTYGHPENKHLCSGQHKCPNKCELCQLNDASKCELDYKHTEYACVIKSIDAKSIARKKDFMKLFQNKLIEEDK
jgi:hypothetical protein